MPDTLINQTLPGFDIYIRAAILYLLQVEGVDPRWKRLGLTQTEMDRAEDYRDEWWTGNIAAPGIYELHSNAATKTTVTRQGVERIMTEFTPFFSNLLRRMATLNFTDTDQETLNIPERDATNTPRGPIGDQPIVGVEAAGGGKLKFRVRITTDADRASLHPLADAIKLKYKIGAQGDVPPANPDECDKEARNTKALFDLATGSGNAGKIIFGYANYVNDVNPANDGPPSTLFQVMIT